MAAVRFDPQDVGPKGLREQGWAWYTIESAMFLVGTDSADPELRPTLEDSDPTPFWRLSEIAQVVEHGDDDPWRVRVARELLAGVMSDLAADPGVH